MSKIAVDVTPLLPGGINGGAKPMVVALLQELPRLLINEEFILWTADYSHDELAFLDRPNLKRVCIHNTNIQTPQKQPLNLRSFAQKAWNWAKHWLPLQVQYRLRALYYSARLSDRAISNLHNKQQQVDFLFCPFGAPTFYNPNIPILSIVYDLQFLDYPDFFSEQERFYRQLHFDQTCRLADHIATISEFTKRSVLKNSNVPADRVTPIHIGLVHDYSTSVESSETQAVLERLKLESQHYLFYPANFWAHKNHKALLQGFQLFMQHYPESDLKIVLTGALDDRRDALLVEAEKTGLGQYLVMPGFLPDVEIGILYRNAKGLIFPSLYEGFGIPLLEAMQAGIPVACSNVTSLPEIGGDAVWYFNPENIDEICHAIEILEFDQVVCEQLIQKGYERLKVFGDAHSMAQNYGSLILRMLDEKKKTYTYGLHGITEDGWFQEKAYLTFPTTSKGKSLEFEIHVPDWMPSKLKVIIKGSNSKTTDFSCDRGGKSYISFELPLSSGIVEICFSASYTPASLGVSNDPRVLSALCKSFQIKSLDGMILFDALYRK